MYSIKNVGLSQFFQSPFNVRLAKILPFTLLRFYLYLLGFIYFLFNSNDRKKIIISMKHVLGFNLKNHVSHLNIIKLFLGVFDHYFEKLVMAHRPLSEMIDFLHPRLYIKNKEYLDKIKETNKGSVLITGHFGAVEFISLALAMSGYNIALICKFKTKKLKEELERRAKKFNVVLIDADEPKVVFKALHAIKDGRILITQCDEFSKWYPYLDKQISVFGYNVAQDKMLDLLHNKTKAPAFIGVLLREKEGFTLCIDPLTNGYEKDLLSFTAWRKFEYYILNYPQQWYQWKELYECVIKKGIINT